MRIPLPAHRFYILSFCLLLSIKGLFAQDGLHYKGPFTISGYNGQADFYYLLKGKDTIYNGSFAMNTLSSAGLFNDTLQHYFKVNGAFDQGTPNGDWMFSMGAFRPASKPSFVNRKIEVAVEGNQQLLSGSFKSGKPNGVWIYREENIDSSEVENVAFSSEVHFQQGVPVQLLKIESDAYSLVGRLLRDGSVHDTWEVYEEGQTEAHEKWNFKNGVLESLVVNTSEFSDTIKMVGRDTAGFSTLKMESAYFDLIKLKWLLYGGAANYNSKLGALIKRHHTPYHSADSVLKSLSGDTAFGSMYVKLKTHPLSSSEHKELKKLQEELTVVQEQLKWVNGRTQFQILRLADEEVHFLLSLLEAIEAKVLKSVEELSRFNDEGILKFVMRENLPQALIYNIDSVSHLKVAYTFNGQQKFRDFTLPNIDDSAFKANGISAFTKIMSSVLISVDSITQALKSRLEKQARVKELDVAEQDLLVQGDSLTKLLDDKLNTLESPYHAALIAIKTEATNALKAYSEIEQVDKKIERTEALINCFQNLIALANAVSAIPQNYNDILDYYTQSVWNPFTSTMMQEEQKRNITLAYKEVLIPYYLREISTDVSCANAQDFVELFKMTNKRMVALKDESTSKLEKRLRRKTEPIEVMNLLKITTL